MIVSRGPTRFGRLIWSLRFGDQLPTHPPCYVSNSYKVSGLLCYIYIYVCVCVSHLVASDQPGQKTSTLSFPCFEKKKKKKKNNNNNNNNKQRSKPTTSDCPVPAPEVRASLAAASASNAAMSAAIAAVEGNRQCIQALWRRDASRAAQNEFCAPARVCSALCGVFQWPCDVWRFCACSPGETTLALLGLRGWHGSEFGRP